MVLLFRLNYETVQKSSKIKFSFHLQGQGHLLDFIKSFEGGAGKCGTVPSYTYTYSPSFPFNTPLLGITQCVCYDVV